MIKIQVISDTHLEFYKKFDFNKNFKINEDIKYLFLAGDIGIPKEKSSLWLPFIEWCSKNYEKVFYIIGNHESYNFKMKDTISFVKQNIEKFDNVFFLEKDVIVDIEGYKVVGCTLWTDLDYESAYYMNDTKMIENDDNPYIPISIDYIKNLYKKDKEWLHTIIPKLHSEGQKIIVMTHHLPSEKCVDEKYKNSKFNKGFVADIDENLITKSNLWIFGHTHCHKDFLIGKTRLYANPFGYKGEISHFRLETISLEE